jgi:glycosyltransferase involved in cell wall biosynthesis
MRGSYSLSRGPDAQPIDRYDSVEPLFSAGRRSIWVVDPLADIPGESLPTSRPWSLARELVARGHEVVWWTSNFSHRRKARRLPPARFAEEEGFSVQIVAAGGYRSDLSWGRFRSARELGRNFRRLAREMVAAGQLDRPDMIVAASPPLETAEAAADLARQLDAMLVIDLLELWPEGLRGLLPSPAWAWSVLAAPWFGHLRRRQTMLLRSADALITNSATAAAAVRRLTGGAIPLEIAPVGAYLQECDAVAPGLSAESGDSSKRSPAQVVSSPRNAAGTGTITAMVLADMNSRADVYAVVDLARELSARGLLGHLHVVGGGRWLHKLGRAAALQQGSFQILCHGVLDRAARARVLQVGDIGIVLPGELVSTALPQSACELLAAGAPLVVPGPGELATLVLQADAGIAPERFEAALVGEAVARLAADSRSLSQARRRARLLAAQMFDRERIALAEADFLESFPVEAASTGPDEVAAASEEV